MDTLILEPYYGNEANASTNLVPSQNARWNALLAYYTHDFNDQQQPHAFSFWLVERSSRMRVAPVPVPEAIISPAAPMRVLAHVPRCFCKRSMFLINAANGFRTSPDPLGRHLYSTIQAGPVTHHESGVPV